MDTTNDASGPVDAVVPCPVLVGRAAELDTLTAALDAAAGGRGAVAFVTGEAGIGKSRLVNEVWSMAAARGMTTLRGRAVPGSSAAPFRPFAEALAAVGPAGELGGDGAGDLGPWLPVLAAIVPTLGASGAPVDAGPPVLGEAVIRLLRAICAPPGGLLVLEDLHWADPETLAIVEHLSDNLARAPVLCLATVRAEEDSPARELVRRIRDRRSAQVLELARLNGAQVAAMVFGCTGGAPAEVVARIVELADGVPFLVEETLVSPGLPASFAGTVESRLGSLPEPDRRVLATAAAFGRHFDWRLLGPATGLSEADVVAALERGVAAQLLAVDGDGFRFRHALTAEAVFHAMVPPRREATAAAALAAFDAVHGEPTGDRRDIAARLAERAGQSERAGRLFLAIGEDALDRGALHTAVIGLERAADLLPDGDTRVPARERLVEALALVGRVDDALRTGHELVDRLPPDRAAAIHLRLAGTAATASRWDAAAAELDRARPLVAAAGAPALDAELALRDGELAFGTDNRAQAEAHARHALDTARRSGVPEMECAALQVLGQCARNSSLADAEVWFGELLAAADAHGLTLWQLRARHELGTIALLDRSEVAELLAAQELAETLGAMATAAVLDIEISAGLAGLHDLEGQRRHGLAAVRRGTELGLGFVVAHGWQRVAGVAALTGDRDEFVRACAAARAAAAGDRDIEGLLVSGELIWALMDEDRNTALAAAARCTDILRGSETAPPMHLRAAWPLLLAVEHRPEATAAAEELGQTVVAVNRAGRSAIAMARAVITGWRDAKQATALAVEADEGLRYVPWWRFVARRLAAEAAVAHGWALPDGWLTEAEDWLRRHGCDRIADACRALRQGTTTPVPVAWARQGVTRREADVLALVVEGLSNREIAERLYLSVRTVEKHVESLLRKTGSRSRTQLAHVAATT